MATRGGTATPEPRAALQEPHIIRVLSWNIDGLDQRNLTERTTAACDVILKEDPDVVCLQEVVPDSAALVLTKFPSDRYQAFFGGDSGYFTAVLLKRSTCFYDDHQVTPFPGSVMGRNLIAVNANVKGLDFTLMTAHLESTAEHAAERQSQLRRALAEMTSAPAAHNVLFGGDLNLRDKDVQAVKGLPSGVVDVWADTGSKADTKYTWDMQLNDNLHFDGFSPRCRFDRFLFRPSTGVGGGGVAKPILFQTVGRERIPTCRRYPSDHWGILAHFFISA